MVTGPRVAAFFDLDKTVIATSSTVAFSRPFLAGGLLTRRAMLRAGFAQLMYLAGSADEAQTERLRVALSRMVAGWDVARLSAIVEESLHDSIDAQVHVEALELIAEHHAAGHDVVVVSASATEIVAPIAAALGADHVVATRMTIEDGRYTGGIDFYAFGENKAAAMRELAERHGYDLAECSAYSDSVTDAPMLDAVGHGFAVNPDRAMRRMAEDHGWQVLDFGRTVRLGDLLTPTARQTLPVVAVGVAVVVGLVLLRRWRRRRS